MSLLRLTLRVESFAGSKFGVYKLSRTPEVKIKFCGDKLSRLGSQMDFVGINFREHGKFLSNFLLLIPF